MDIQKEKNLLELRNKLLAEIKYREEILTSLKWDSNKEKGFVSNFIRGFLGKKNPAPNLFWKDRETYGRYLIDADKELHKDFQIALQKSINKLQEDYQKSYNYEN